MMGTMDGLDALLHAVEGGIFVPLNSLTGCGDDCGD